MRAYHALVFTVVVLGLASWAHPEFACAEPAGVLPETQVILPEEMSRYVVVEQVVAEGGEVSGVVRNISGGTLRDIRLLIEYAWLWHDEFSPGSDDPGRVVHYTLPGELPPGGSVPFRYLEPALPNRSDGRFVTSVEVTGLVALTERCCPQQPTSLDATP